MKPILISIKFSSLISLLVYFSVLVFNCSKESFPRITKLVIQNNSGTNCKSSLNVIDLSSATHGNYGVEYSRDNSFTNKRELIFSNILKGANQCIDSIADSCGGIYYVKAFYFENQVKIFGPIQKVSIISPNFTYPSIVGLDTISNPSKLIVNFTIPKNSILATKVIFCYSKNKESEVTISDNPQPITPIKYGINTYTLDLETNVKYKIKVFVEICSNLYSSETQSYTKTNTGLNCTVTSGPITVYQVSKTKIKIKGSLATIFPLNDYGFCIDNCINASSKLSLKQQSLSNLNTIYTTIPNASHNIQYYFQCEYNKPIEATDTAFIKLVNPELKLSKSYNYISTTKELNISCSFNVNNYECLEYGICYSKTRVMPEIGIDSKVIISSNNLLPLTMFGKIPISNNSITYFRYYITDQDVTFYSDTGQFLLPSQSSCIFNSSQIADHPSIATINVASFLINGTYYAGCGRTNSISTKLFYRYDRPANRFIRLADNTLLSNGMQYGVAGYFVVNNKGYVLQRNDKSFSEFDPFLETWKSATYFSGKKREGSASAGNGVSGFIIGGKSESNEILYENWKYSNGIWFQIKLNSSIGTRINSCCFIIGDILYIFGGESSDNNFWKYSISGDSWQKEAVHVLPNELVSFDGGTCFVLKNIAYIIKQNSSAIWSFEPGNGWHKCNSISPLLNKYGSSASDGNEVFYGFGENDIKNVINIK